LEAESEGTEETLHRKECDVADQMERPEGSRGAMKAGHEVDDEVVSEQSNGGEGQVGEQVGDWECGTSVHAIAGLKVVIVQGDERWCHEPPKKLTCLFNIERPNIMRGISPKESKMATKRATKMTLPRVKPPAAVNGRSK
jgi:hypothetical protein